MLKAASIHILHWQGALQREGALPSSVKCSLIQSIQVRTQVLNDEWDDTFRIWYPDFRPIQTLVPASRVAA